MGDEKQARAALADMQARLARSPYDALNIPAGSVGPAEVRTAFLQLTKTFHPAKFARMSTDVQKLANEVFLGLRAAHDQLARPRGAVPAPVRQTGTMPVLQRASDSGARLPMAQPSPARPATAPPSRPSQPIPTVARAVGSTRPIPTAGAPRGATPAMGVPVTNGGGARPAPTAAARPAGTPARLTPAMGVPVTSPGARTTGPARPAAAPGTGPRPTVEPELAPIYDLLQKQQWQAAHAAIAARVAHAPQHARYRALAHYARGREAQLAHRLDDARVELHEALQLDPDLQIAKTALAELFTRRK